MEQRRGVVRFVGEEGERGFSTFKASHAAQTVDAEEGLADLMWDRKGVRLPRAPDSLPPPDRKVDVRLPGKGNSNSHGARPVHLIITMVNWIRTSRLSIKNSLSAASCLRVCG